MYLSKHTYIGNKYREGAQLVRVAVPSEADQAGVTFPVESIKDERISEIKEEVGYWRKANQIHKWFVDNVQEGEDDCKEYYVSREQLQALLDICRKVKAASKLVDGKIQNCTRWTKEKGEEPIMEDGKYIEDPTVAKELLPTAEGFFFGSTEYDQYYLQDVEDTIEILEVALAESGGDFYYQSSW